MAVSDRDNESVSIAALRRLQVLDTAPEAEFDALVQIASSICGVPISLISLIDTDRQWFKANVGLPGVEQTPREQAFCAHAVLGADLFEVEDATQDPRFADNPLVVGQPDIRFYAGAPLTLSSGETVGTLCVIDRKPGRLTDQQRDLLRKLSVAAAKLLEGRLAIREHVLAAQAVAAIEHDLRLVVENVPAMIAHWNADLTCRFANPAYCAWFGVDPNELIGKHIRELLGPALFALNKPCLEAALQGQVQTFERKVLGPSGTFRWAVVQYVPDVVGGKVKGLLAHVTDVTALKSTEEALRKEIVEHAQAHDRLQAMYETTPALLHSIDPQGRLLHVSDAWLACMGYRREDVIGRVKTEFLTEASRQRAHEQVLPALFATGRVDNVPYQLVTSRGETVDVVLSAVMERDPLGQPVRSLSVMTDVTARLRAERELDREHERLRNLIEATHAGTWEWNVQTGEVIINRRWAEIIGWTAEELGTVTEQFRADIAHPDELSDTRRLLREHLAGISQAYVAELRLRHRDGHWIWAEERGRLITRTPDGRPEWVFGIYLDITERKRRDETLLQLSAALAQQHELMRITLQSIGDAVITTDADCVVTWLNPVAERMTGWLAAEAQGLPLTQVFNIVHEETRAVTENPVATCLEQRKIVGLANHTLLISRDGTEFGIEDSAAPIRNAAGEVLGVVLVFHDVSEQRRMSSEMTYRATHDALTGLVNRTEFEARLSRVLRKAHEEQTEHALLYIDLDQFKLINDACGHAIGDQLLQQVTRLLSETVRTRDTLARLGGDEFAIILEHCTADQAAQVAQKICDRMDDFRFIHGDRRFRVGTSIGLVPVDTRWTSIAAVQQAADTSCYAAKEAGRNRVHAWFDTDLAMRARQFEMQWTSRIERALDDDGFVLFAQRVQGLKQQHQGLHAEVLLRMKNEDGSLTQPGAFLPAAERFHLVSRVDRWVLRQAVSWMSALADISVIDTLSVNLSGQSVGDRAFHAWANDMLARAGAGICTRLCLEITETATVTNLADAAIFIASVRAAGVRVALDDFGAGASSFGYLKTLLVDCLKIDGQFIRDLTQDPLDEAAVRCFMEVAKVVGVQTVAEFVEQPDVLERLRLLGVDYAQGYLIHRPEPIDMLLDKSRATVC